MNKNKIYSVLNSNICTTYRMEFCEEIKEFQSDEKIKEINLYKSKNRIAKIFDIYSKFYQNSIEKFSTSIFTIQELRSYLLNDFSNYFDKLDYQLITFPSYPEVKTEEIIIDSDDDSSKMNERKRLKRFSFINAIAVPKSLEIVNKFLFYLSETPYEFNSVNTWGNSGSRVCGGIEVRSPEGKLLKIYSTQFGMDVNERLKSSDLIVEFFLCEKLPTLICGDFNSFSNLDNFDYKGKEQIEIIEKTFRRVPITGGTFIGIRPVEKEIYCINLENGFISSCLDHFFYKGEIKYLDYGSIVPDNRTERILPFSDDCFIWLDFEIQ
jgi:hypothetical protein